MADASPAQASRYSRRTKTLEVYPENDGLYFFRTSLLDQSFGGSYEVESDHVDVHDFTLWGRVRGEDLVVTEMEARAEQHPFPQCPFVLPATEHLIGQSLTAGWRSLVLDRFKGAAGCTHVTTLLLGLSEVITLVYFQRMNQQAPYGPRTRGTGEWISGNMELAPGLLGACHALDQGSPVVRRARVFRARRQGDSG